MVGVQALSAQVRAFPEIGHAETDRHRATPIDREGLSGLLIRLPSRSVAKWPNPVTTGRPPGAGPSDSSRSRVPQNAWNEL